MSAVETPVVALEQVDTTCHRWLATNLDLATRHSFTYRHSFRRHRRVSDRALTLVIHA